MDAIVDSRYGRDRWPLVVLGAFRGFCWVRRTCEVRAVSVRECVPSFSELPLYTILTADARCTHFVPVRWFLFLFVSFDYGGWARG